MFAGLICLSSFLTTFIVRKYLDSQKPQRIPRFARHVSFSRPLPSSRRYTQSSQRGRTQRIAKASLSKAEAKKKHKKKHKISRSRNPYPSLSKPTGMKKDRKRFKPGFLVRKSSCPRRLSQS